MKPDSRFLQQPKHFWANVRSISEKHGYTNRRTSQIKIPTFEQMKRALLNLNLGTDHVVDTQDKPTTFGRTLLAYFEYRADVLNNFVEPRLMDVAPARTLYEQLRAELKPARETPMNKQRGDKKAPAYFTGLINMYIEANAQGLPCDYDPRQLTTFTVDGAPLRTLARRVDGAFPSAVNPIAVWEIKEYYYTTTFGSRVADGVYETLLDGMELEELREHENIEVKHYLMVDSHYTWWQCGRSYLCRIIDMLHMGYVDEVLFGREVVDRMPAIVNEWIQIAKSRASVGQPTIGTTQ